MAGRADAQAEAGSHVIPDIVFLGTGFGGADALGEGGADLPRSLTSRGSLCWAERPVVRIGSGRGGISPRKPSGRAGQGEP